MALTSLKKAWDSDVEKWLAESLNLTPYQVKKMKDDELIRFSKFRFYTPVKRQDNLLWRLSIIFYLPYIVCLYAGLPFTFLVRGRWGYGQKFYDNFHAKWTRNIGM